MTVGEVDVDIRVSLEHTSNDWLRNYHLMWCVVCWCAVLWYVRCRAEAGKQVLSNALEVYVNDPVVDWLKGPLDKESEEGASAYVLLREDVTWEPRRRIANAVRKMEGVHPVELMVEDLEVSEEKEQ